MGREVPLTALIVARKSYGWDGSFLFSALFTVVNLGWFGLNTEIVAQILAAITHSSTALWDIIVGGFEIVLVLYGMKWLERFYRYTSGVLIVCYVALTIYLVTHFTLHVPKQTIPMNWGTALTVVLTFSILAWTYKLSTTSRFAVSSAKTGGRKASYFLLPSIGIMLAVLVMGVLGAFSNQATGNWNIALLGAHISSWGFVAAMGAALAVLHTNAMNLYPSTVDLLVVINRVHKPTSRWQQPIATIILGVGGIALAIAGILSHVSTLLSDAGDIVIPFTFVMLADWLYIQKRRTQAGEFFDAPTTRAERLAPVAIGTVVIGFVIGYWGDKFLREFFYNTLPVPVVGGLVAAALYAAGSRIWPPASAMLATDNPVRVPPVPPTVSSNGELIPL